MPFSRDSYQRLNTAKYGRVETDEPCGFTQQTNVPDLEDDDLVGYSVDFTEPKDSFVGRVARSCNKMRRIFLAALRFVLKVAFGKWPIALIILICYIGLTAGLISIALTGKYHEFRIDMSLQSFMVPDIKVSSDFAAFNGAKGQAKNTEISFKTFLNSETCTGNKINPVPKQYPRRLKRSISDPSAQRRASWTLDLVYVAKGSEDADNIFTTPRLQEIHSIEKLLMQHENYQKHCYISDLSIKDPALNAYGNCTPPNSLINFFYPNKKGNFDGQGENLVRPVDETLQFLQSKDYFFFYVDDDFIKNHNRSKILRAQILFGRPVEGIPKTGQNEEFTRYVRTYVETLDNLNNNNKVSILYGGGDVFDYLVNKALLSDVRLAAISLGLVVLLLLILTFSWWLSIMAVLTIVFSVALSYFFYRVVFGIQFMGILNGVSLFVIIGIGVDDIFVFINTFRQAVDNKDLGDRITHTIYVAGKATFFTSFTTAAAFGANALSPIPAIHDFGLFMAILVTSCWVSVIFIMSPALTLWHAGIAKCESAMCSTILSAIGVKRSESMRLPDDIRRFLSGIAITSGSHNHSGYESDHEAIPLVSNNNDDDDDDDDPLLVLENESSSTATQTLYGTADAIGFRLQSVLYHYVAIPVIKGRVVIFVIYLFLLAGSALFMAKLQVSKEQPKFFKADSNLQKWLELPDVSLDKGKNRMMIDIRKWKDTLHPTVETSHLTPKPKHTQSRTRTSTRKHSPPFSRQPTTKPSLTRKPPATKPKKHSTRARATKMPATGAPTTQETYTRPVTATVPTKSHVETVHPDTSTTMSSQPPSKHSWVTTSGYNGSALTTVKPKLNCPACANGVCNNETLKCDCRVSYTGETCSQYCPVRTMTGDCCVIPFTHNGAKQQGCLIDQYSGKPWCSLTSDFDKDRKKGECNMTVERRCAIRTDTPNKTCCSFPFVYKQVQYYNCMIMDEVKGTATYCGIQPYVASKNDLKRCPSAPKLCSEKNKCTIAKPPPSQATALVYLVFGIKGIDRTSVDLRHVLKENQGKIFYDKAFAKDMSCSTEEMLRSACRICKKFGFNKDLVKHSECFPDKVQAALGARFPDDCVDLPPSANSDSIKSIIAMKRDPERGFEVEWFAMAFSSTTGKLSSYTSQHKDYRKWEKQLEDVLSEKGVPDSLKSAFQTSETWVDMFSGEIVVTSAVYGILVSLLLCKAAVIIFTGHVLLVIVLFLTILGVLLMVMAIFYLTGWQLGGVEAISLSILVGTSVDYCFHLVEGYILAGEAVNPTLNNMAARQWRAKAAMSHIGMSIISSAITTILAAIPLCLTQIQLFAKFGLIVTINTGISLLYTVTVTMAMLSIFGPARFRASLGASAKGFLFVGLCMGCGVLVLYLVSTKGGQCIPGPSGTPIFDC